MARRPSYVFFSLEPAAHFSTILIFRWFFGVALLSSPGFFFFFNCLFFPSYRSNPIILLPVLHIGICLIRYFFLTSYLKKVYILWKAGSICSPFNICITLTYVYQWLSFATFITLPLLILLKHLALVIHYRH